jgi:hypothetical protein
MPTAPTFVDDIDIGRVFFDLANPRHEPYEVEDQAIQYLCDHEDVYPLARDIARLGLNPLERLALIPVKSRTGQITGYTMAEGNRRLCAIKLLGDPERAPANLRKAFEQVVKEYSYIPMKKISGAVFEKKEDFVIWRDRLHGGAQGGIGRRNWNAEQKQRSTGTSKNKIAQLFLDYAQSKSMLTSEERKRRLTTVQRFLGNGIFRDTLGLDVDQTDPEQLNRTRPEAEFDVIARRFVRDLVAGKANSRMNSPQIVLYSHPLSAMPGVSTVRIPAEPLIASPASAPTRRTAPRRPTRARHLRYEEEVATALSSYGNGKLESLYYSICDIDLEKHTPIVAVGVWAFFETLTACAGRNDNTAFDDFLDNSRLGTYGLARGAGRTAVRNALDRLRDYGNVTKHDAIAATYNGDQLNNDMIALKTVILKCIEEAASKSS